VKTPATCGFLLTLLTLLAPACVTDVLVAVADDDTVWDDDTSLPDDDTADDDSAEPDDYPPLPEGAIAMYLGETVDDHAGGVAGAGDTNADGYADLLIGASGVDAGAAEGGATYLVLGPPEPGVHGLADADTILLGEAEGDHASYAVGPGDVNADGYDDVLVGANLQCGAGQFAGAVYLLYGPLPPGVQSLSGADVKLTGEQEFEYVGSTLSPAGDTDADGYDDILVGANGEGTGGSTAGAAYLLLGPLPDGTHDLSIADAKFIGEADSANLGRLVEPAGDLDGDGYDDMVIAGTSMGGVVFGPPETGVQGISSAASATITHPLFWVMFYRAAASDLDGDGLDDLLVSTSSMEQIHMWYGPGPAGPTLTDDSDLTFVPDPTHMGYSFGTGLAAIGDMDGDGIDDFAVGDSSEPTGDGYGTGAAYVFPGWGS